MYFVLLLLYLGVGTLPVPVAEGKFFLSPGKPYVFGRPVCSAGTELFGRRFGGGVVLFKTQLFRIFKAA